MRRQQRLVNLDQVNVPARLLESEEAARRLGVKLATLYAYVSRGLLQSYRSPTPGRSLFDVEEVEALARRARGGKQVETRVATITTAITQLRPSGPFYRGFSATELARSSSFERVADLLWESSGGNWEPLALKPPTRMGAADILRWVVVMAGARDRERSDPHPELVAQRMRTLIATMASVCGPSADVVGDRSQLLVDGSIADRVARRLTPSPTRRGVARALNAAMVLLADHELATSTLAVRVAASTRADIYDATLAGLGTIGGPLHGGAGLLACRMLYRAESAGAERAVDEVLMTHRSIPGFGHPVYQEGDPRAEVLLAEFERIANARQHQVVRTVLEAASKRQQRLPNVDLSLAALAYATEMAPETVATIFTISRMAGWGAHYLEELGERPLRYRARAVYTVAPSHA